MRTAIISDIHGNLAALEAVIADLRFTSPDIIFHGGDLAASGAHPAEALTGFAISGGQAFVEILTKCFGIARVSGTTRQNSRSSKAFSERWRK